MGPRTLFEDVMTRRHVNSSDWPRLDAPLLREVSAAFLQRRKAIRYRAGLSCERESSETSTGAFERLNLNLQPGSGQLRLGVWEDGKLWLCLSRSGRGRYNGWAFMDHFYGHIHDVSPATLVRMVEATIAEPFHLVHSDPNEYRAKLRKTWSRVNPTCE
jgi:hypothetical protein